MHTTTVENLKEQLHLLIEQLSSDELTELLRVVEPLITQRRPVATNGIANGTSYAEDSLFTNQTWLGSIDKLNDSPNWGEFLDDLDTVRNENNIT